MAVMRLRNRRDAGRQLGARLAAYANRPGVQVLALPRGGVPVGFEVARAINAPLDVFVVRKLGAPGNRELAMGAIASGGVRVVNDEVIRYLQIPPHAIESVAAQEQLELERREVVYRGSRKPADVRGRMRRFVVELAARRQLDVGTQDGMGDAEDGRVVHQLLEDRVALQEAGDVLVLRAGRGRV